jgi:hypothetical protein
MAKKKDFCKGTDTGDFAGHLLHATTGIVNCAVYYTDKKKIKFSLNKRKLRVEQFQSLLTND